jgi:adenosine deaminase
VPEHLTHHVRDAVGVAGAERIGHGVDIVWESDSISVLNRMKNDQIAVEICFASNDDILGISGPDHPVSVYLQHGVPIVICTDDAGVARISLESQYTILASSYRITYAEIKTIVMNSVRHAFLCSNDKAKLLDLVERRFETFESQIAEMTRSLEK